MNQPVISRAVTVAGGRFAPGHLGELTQQVPFEMVDAVLEETCRVQRRVRDLPACVVVYLLLAGCLFAELGYTQVWHRVAAGLGGLPAVYSKQRGGANGASGYPMLRLPVLVSCSTRTVIDAVFSPVRKGETTCAPGLLGGLHAGMILLADRNVGTGFLAAQIAGTRADFLIRVRRGNCSPKLPVLSRCGDGSWLSRLGGIPVRVIDAEITVTTSTGPRALGSRRPFSSCRGWPGRGGHGRGTAGQGSSAGTWPGPGQVRQGESRRDGAGSCPLWNR